MTTFFDILLLAAAIAAALAIAVRFGDTFENRPTRPPRSHHEDLSSRPPAHWLD